MDNKKQEKKSRVQVKKERLINASMRQTSKWTKENLGIAAVNAKEGIFQKVNESFVKIYSIKGLDNSELRKENIIKSLCENTKKRVRISGYLYGESNKIPIFFLSVYFNGSLYSEVLDEIEAFEEILDRVRKDNIRVKIETITISDVLMTIYMNYNGKTKKVSQKMLMRKAANWRKEYFLPIESQEEGFKIFKNGRLGLCYMAIQYPDSLEPLYEEIRRVGCTVLSCVDMQVLTRKNVAAYKEYLEEIYNSPIEKNEERLVNATYIIAFLVNSDNEKKQIEEIVKRCFSHQKLVLSPCVGAEEIVVDSIASIGLVDFTSMRNVNEEIIPSLLL